MTVSLMERLNIESANGPSPYSAKTPYSGQVGLEWLIKLNPDIIFMYQAPNHNLSIQKSGRTFLLLRTIGSMKSTWLGANRKAHTLDCG